MLSKALPFLREVLHGGLTQSLAYFGLCRGPWQELPGAVALQRPLREAFLPRGAQHAATRGTEVTFPCVVRPRQAWHVIAVEQARPRAPADGVEVQTTLREGRRGLGPPAHRVKIPTQLSRDLCSAQRTCGWRFSDGGEVTEPGSALLKRLVGLGTGRERRLETVNQLGQTWLIALGEQVETTTGYGVEPLGGLHAGQAQGWPAFEGQEVAGGAKELGDDRIGLRLWCWRRRDGSLALGLWPRSRLLRPDRTGQQARHRADAGLAGCRVGFLADHVAHLLAHGLAPRHLEGRIDCGERVSQVAQRRGLAPWRATVGQDRGPRRCQARLLVAAHRQNRPFQVRERCEEGFEWGVIVLGQPATASGPAAGECTDAPNVRLASLGRSPIKGDEQAPLLRGHLRHMVSVLTLVAGQQRQRALLRESAHMGL